MITRFVEIDGDDYGYTGTKMTQRSEYYGLSTDVKPTTGVQNADIFYEMDKTPDADGYLKHKVYLFDADSQTWLEQ